MSLAGFFRKIVHATSSASKCHRSVIDSLTDPAVEMLAASAVANGFNIYIEAGHLRKRIHAGDFCRGVLLIFDYLDLGPIGYGSHVEFMVRKSPRCFVISESRTSSVDAVYQAAVDDMTAGAECSVIAHASPEMTRAWCTGFHGMQRGDFLTTAPDTGQIWRH